MIKGLMKFLLKNYHIATILLLVVFIVGYFCASKLDVMGDPNITFDQIDISVNYPGAQPKEVVDGVALKVENAISEISGIKYYETNVTEGNCDISVYIKDGFDIQKIKDKVEEKINSIDDFPKDVEKPEITIPNSGSGIAYFFIYGDATKRQLRDIALDLKDQLNSLPDIPKVEVEGIGDPEINISVSDDVLRKYNLDINEISNAIERSSLDVSAGDIQTESESFKVSVEGKKLDVEDFLNIPVILKNGTVLRLRKIAQIKNIIPDDDYEYIVNGYPGIGIFVWKLNDVHGNNLKIAQSAITLFEKYKATLPPTLKTVTFNGTDHIKNSLVMLLEHGLLGLFFVLIILWCFMGNRLSSRIALAVPFSLMGTMIVFYIFNISINIISMFGLLMVTGIVVDFGIVVAESFYVRSIKGMDIESAVIEGTEHVFLPLLVALLCNILAFMPILYLNGAMGKLMADIPKAVIITLIISFFQAFIILPVYLRKINVSKVGSERGFIERYTLKINNCFNQGIDSMINKVYKKLLPSLLAWRYTVLAVCMMIIILIFGLINSGIIKYVFLPKGGALQIKSEIQMPYGTPFDTSKIIADKVYKGWLKTVKKFNPDNNPDFYKIMDINVSTRSISAKVFFYHSMEPEFLNRITNYWGKQVGVIPGAEKSTFEIKRNVGMGNPIAVNIYGDDDEKLYAAALSLEDKLETYKGIKNVYISYSFGEDAFVIKLKPLADYLGLTNSQIGSQIRNSFYHKQAVNIQKKDGELSVNISYSEDTSKKSVASLSNMQIETATGKYVPLKSIADITIEPSPSSINRKNGKSTIYVGAGIEPDIANAAEIMGDLKNNFFPVLKSKYNVTFTQEGESKESSTVFASLSMSIPLVLMAMYFILVMIFKSYIQPLLVLITIPLGMIGSFIGLYIIGIPLSILAIFGIVAMSGIVVNNSIVYVNEVNRCMHSGLKFTDSLLESGCRRFRPILFTKLCTFSGLVPLMFVSGTITQLIVPIAVVIAFGVLFTIFVTLLVLPCVIYILNDVRRTIFFVRFSKHALREQVEPAYIERR